MHKTYYSFDYFKKIIRTVGEVGIVLTSPEVRRLLRCMMISELY